MLGIRAIKNSPGCLSVCVCGHSLQPGRDVAQRDRGGRLHHVRHQPGVEGGAQGGQGWQGRGQPQPRLPEATRRIRSLQTG